MLKDHSVTVSKADPERRRGDSAEGRELIELLERGTMKALSRVPLSSTSGRARPRDRTCRLFAGMGTKPYQGHQPTPAPRPRKDDMAEWTWNP